MISETYRDIEIVLLESENKWRFTVNGRERTAPTLPKAREYIDNALDAVATRREKPWEPFEAWYEERYGSREYVKVRVTSEADRDYGGRQFWTTREVEREFGQKENKRQKIQMDYLFAVTPENDKRIERVTALRAEADRLYEQAAEIRAALSPILSEEAVAQ